jgi:site-specific recombinase
MSESATAERPVEAPVPEPTCSTPARAAFRAFIAAADAPARADAFVALVQAIRPPDDAAWSAGAQVDMLDYLESEGEDHERFGAALAAFFSGVDATNLVGVAGIPGQRGFFNEFSDRLAGHLLPAPREGRDLRELSHRLYSTRQETEQLREVPQELFHRVVAALAAAPPAGAWDGLRGAFADGFRLLLTRVESEGLSPKLRSRATACPVSASPFHRAGAAGGALLAAWLADAELSEPAAAFRTVLTACGEELRVVQQHLDGSGVSIDIVFSLEVIERCLTRATLMTEIMEAPDGPMRSRAIHRLLYRLVQSASEDRSLRHLVGWNMKLLGRKIVDRSSETGEHYIARTRSEYRHIWLAAAGGGALTVGTAAVKTMIHAWHVEELPEGLLYGLNYAVSFLLLQHLGLMLATKQPAATAARLAAIIRSSDGEDREQAVAIAFSQLTRSQLAAAVANVVVVAVGASAFSWLFLTLTGRPFMAHEEVVDTLRVMSPINSFTVWYAALTGVVLWLASVAGGWFENWCVYHRLAEGIARHPARTAWQRRLRQRIGDALSRHAAGWGTNVSLGFMLGMAPEVGRITGLPFDVRHVTLSTGVVSLAASGVDVNPLLYWLWLAIGGVGVMFVLNLSVSFACSLFSAARAYDLPTRDLIGLLKGIGRRLLRTPLAFVRPPRATTPAAGH